VKITMSKKEVPEPLYHYTTINGFLGIME